MAIPRPVVAALLLGLLPRRLQSGFPVDSVWMYGRDSEPQWDSALRSFHAIGGSGVWMFGSSLERTTAAALRAAPATQGCLVGGTPCADAAAAGLRARGVSVRQYFSWAQSSQLDGAILTPCAGVAGSGEFHLPPGVGNGSKNEYWTLVLPRGPTPHSCLLPRGSEVDFVVVSMANALYTPTPYDMTRLLLDATERARMEAFAPMPGLPADPAAAWQIDALAMPAFEGLVRRTTTDLCQRFGGRQSLAGVYQSHEMPVNGVGFWKEQYDSYDRAARAVHTTMESCQHRQRRLKVAISPYWFVNKRGAPNGTLANSVAGIEALARTDLDLIAPQEGRGTGKAATFWVHERSLPVSAVDPNLARYPNVRGNESFASRFFASTHELYRGGRAAIDRVNAALPASSRKEIWMNLEAFEATKINVCGAGGSDRTNKTRLDRSLTFGAGAVGHVVSFMWDPFFTCTPPGYEQSLSEEIESDADRPILLDATTSSAAGESGSGGLLEVEMRGVNLCGAGARTAWVSWLNPAAAERSVRPVPLGSCTADGGAQVARLLLPADIGDAWRRADGADGYLGLTVEAAGKNATTEFALAPAG